MIIRNIWVKLGALIESASVKIRKSRKIKSVLAPARDIFAMCFLKNIIGSKVTEAIASCGLTSINRLIPAKPGMEAPNVGIAANIKMKIAGLWVSNRAKKRMMAIESTMKIQ